MWLLSVAIFVMKSPTAYTFHVPDSSRSDTSTWPSKVSALFKEDSGMSMSEGNNMGAWKDMLY